MYAPLVKFKFGKRISRACKITVCFHFYMMIKFLRENSNIMYIHLLPNLTILNEVYCTFAVLAAGLPPFSAPKC